MAAPLAQCLNRRGIDVWLGEWELTLGDSLRRRIEQAISEASFGVVIMSPAYMRKNWPIRELVSCRSEFVSILALGDAHRSTSS